MQCGEGGVGVLNLPSYVEAELLFLRFPPTYQVQVTSAKFILAIIYTKSFTGTWQEHVTTTHVPS